MFIKNHDFCKFLFQIPAMCCILHVSYLNNKLDALGRLYLSGCISVHVKQVYFASGCKTPGVGHIWMSRQISHAWDQGVIASNTILLIGDTL